MSEQAIHWDAEALWQQLEPLLPGLSVEVVRSTTSTNTALLDRARAASGARAGAGEVGRGQNIECMAFGSRAVDLHPCLLVAEHQSDGRGRQGRAWQSAAGASLTFSLSLPLTAADWSGLSLAVGVALSDALDPLAGGEPTNRARDSHIGLKWPNDLWLVDANSIGPAMGRKLGGILIETVATGSRRLAIVGVGLNVLPFVATDVGSGFASLRELDPSATAPAVLARVALPLVRGLALFEREGFTAFAERFAARDVLVGRPVRTTTAEVPEGIARGVSSRGALLVQSAAGIAAVTSGAVSVRLAPTPQARAGRVAPC